MKLPKINIAFSTQAQTAISRSQKGVVAILLKDANANGGYVFTSPNQIPSELGTANRDYIARAFTGYVNPPQKVIAYVIPGDAEDLSEGLSYFETQVFDYLVGPLDITAAESGAVAAWIKAQRLLGHTPKAVLPNLSSDSEAVINFVAGGIKVGAQAYTTAEYCSRIAGIVAGTPMTISCTYAPLPEVTDIARLSREAMDTAVGQGKFILFHDGEKVKVGRAVNSLVTTTESKGEAFKKIKIVEAVDMIQKDIRATAQDNYIGKYANSYDSKCLLISAIKGYFTGLENDGVLELGTSTVGIDLDAQEAYLISRGLDTSGMSEQEIKAAPTADQVFLKATVSILDAIEDINLNITI